LFKNSDIASLSFHSWFHHSNYNSFQRQLNIYGFCRFPDGRDKDSYYHQNFVRGEMEPVLRIRRNAVKGTRVRQPSDITTYPNFYSQVRDDSGSDHASSTPAAVSTIPSHSGHEPPHPSLLNVAASLTQSSIIPFTADPNNNQQHRDLALQAIAGPGNPNHDGRFPYAMNAALLETFLPSAALNLSSLIQTGLSPRDQNSLESSLLQRMNQSRPLVVEQMMHNQALINSLQQQLRSNQDGMPLFVNGSLINPNNNDSPLFTVNTEVLDPFRQPHNPNGGAGL
jgi:HSF-type DNA-binding